jgi:hypothetical protein
VLTDWTLPSIDLFAVYPTGRMPSANALAVVAFVEAELKEGRSLTADPCEASELSCARNIEATVKQGLKSRY